MPFDPDELRALELPRAFRGYSREAVDRLVSGLADLVEELEQQRQQLGERASSAEQALERALEERRLLFAAVEELRTERAESQAYLEQLEAEVAPEKHGRRSALESALEALASLRGNARAS
ncbi:MAG: hypothetical protein ACRDLM_05790 [Gaiellaceae bacterium]